MKLRTLSQVGSKRKQKRCYYIMASCRSVLCKFVIGRIALSSGSIAHIHGWNHAHNLWPNAEMVSITNGHFPSLLSAQYMDWDRGEQTTLLGYLDATGLGGERHTQREKLCISCKVQNGKRKGREEGREEKEEVMTLRLYPSRCRFLPLPPLSLAPSLWSLWPLSLPHSTSSSPLFLSLLPFPSFSSSL